MRLVRWSVGALNLSTFKYRPHWYVSLRVIPHAISARLHSYASYGLVMEHKYQSPIDHRHTATKAPRYKVIERDPLNADSNIRVIRPLKLGCRSGRRVGGSPRHFTV